MGSEKKEEKDTKDDKWVKTKKPKKVKKGGEYGEQCKVIEWANRSMFKYPDLRFLYASLNGVRLPIGSANKAKNMGMKSGVPDLFLPTARRYYHGLYIEMKYNKGVTSDEQRLWISYLESQHFKCSVCYTSEDACKVIRNYLSLFTP